MRIKHLLIISFSFICFGANAQMAIKKMPPIPTGDVNKTDAKGKRDGMWLITQPARMGEPSSTEFGNYEHGNKTGLWYKLGGEGDLLAVETFKNNVLDGEAKYYENGRVNCIGYYRGLNPNHDFDTVFVLDPVTHNEVTRIIPTERGTVRHGTWRFYDTDNGRMIREEDYQVDELVFTKEYPYSKADSAAILKRETKLPHNKGNVYKPPVSKQVSYTEAKKNG